MRNLSSQQAVRHASTIVGGQSALARILGVSAPTISQWVSGVRPIPPERCTDIERVSGGQVSRRDLRPNDWQRIWPELEETDPVGDGVAQPPLHPDSEETSDIALALIHGVPLTPEKTDRLADLCLKAATDPTADDNELDAS